ncbi:MAG: NlpC/P60 family protein, partial [Pseudomonadota bacterium]
PPHFLASLTSEIAATDRDGNWVKADRGGWLFVDHLAPLSVFADDFVAVAEQFVGAPYLWGGKESLGLDCSGLVQTALAAAGVAAPRDSDMQEAAIGAPISHAADLSNLQRGDLVFWRGHVGVMIDEKHLLHANAHHMATAIEPLVQTVERLTPAVGPIRSVRRL